MAGKTTTSMGIAGKGSGITIPAELMDIVFYCCDTANLVCNSCTLSHCFEAGDGAEGEGILDGSILLKPCRGEETSFMA